MEDAKAVVASKREEIQKYHQEIITKANAKIRQKILEIRALKMEHESLFEQLQGMEDTMQPHDGAPIIEIDALKRA